MSTLRRWVVRAIDQLQGQSPQVRRPQRIFFIHIAKTAGTSMRRMLEREFGARFGTAVSRSVRRDLVHRSEGSELAEFIPRLEPFLEHDRALYERAQAAFVPAG